MSTESWTLFKNGRPVARLQNARAAGPPWTKWEMTLLDGVGEEGWTAAFWDGAVSGQREHDGKREERVTVRVVGDGTVLVRTSAGRGPTGADRRRGGETWLRRVWRRWRG